MFMGGRSLERFMVKSMRLNLLVSNFELCFADHSYAPLLRMAEFIILCVLVVPLCASAMPCS